MFVSEKIKDTKTRKLRIDWLKCLPLVIFFYISHMYVSKARTCPTESPYSNLCLMASKSYSNICEQQ